MAKKELLQVPIFLSHASHSASEVTVTDETLRLSHPCLSPATFPWQSTVCSTATDGPFNPRQQTQRYAALIKSKLDKVETAQKNLSAHH